MNGNSYKLRKHREDLYNRVKKTLNIDYDPKQLKPFLKKLSKLEAVNKLKPIGLAHEARFPTKLRTKFKFMLSPMAQNDLKLFEIMGGGKSKNTEIV